MVDISASMVKDLREKSGAAMMDCKKALVEAEGDLEKAFELLRQKGVAVASKKSGRSASEGLVVGQISADGKQGAIVEINCETDFVARNDQFIELTKQATELILKNKPADVDAFLEQSAGDKKVKDLVTEAVAKIGENIIIRRLAVFEATGEGIVGLYIHALGGKMGALLELSSSKAADREKLAAIAREVAMHVVSAKPQFISKDEIPADVIENERRIELGKADLAEKKPEMREKIVTGRVDKLMNERSLNEQMFVKDPNNSVGKYLQLKGAELGTELKAVRFALFILGEQAAETNGKEE
ncbi:MAG: elongation factor Ts [Cyanobacteria bacterium SZAS-4]|nr:elongation factor Ts [Cyanobacteria bacterium SZAS-4]